MRNHKINEEYSEIDKLNSEIDKLRNELYLTNNSVGWTTIVFLRKKLPFLIRPYAYLFIKLRSIYIKYDDRKNENAEPNPKLFKFLKIENKHLELLHKRKKKDSLTNKKSRKIALVTVIVNNYDSLLIPNIVEDRVDYICFSNTALNNYGIWDIRPIPYFHPNPTKICRFVKLNLHLLINGYDYVIWKDANINLNKPCTLWVKELIDKNKNLGLIKHPIRNNIFEEAIACKELGKDEAIIINKQMSFYSKDRAKLSKSTLIESNFMIINFSDANVKKVFYNWWKELNNFSIRDQLSLPKVLYKRNIKIQYLLPSRLCVRFSDFFDYYVHKDSRYLKYSKKVNKVGIEINPYDYESLYKNSEDILDYPNNIMQTTVDIILCVHNALDDVRKCCDSVISSLKGNHKLIIVNDASDYKTSNYLNEISDGKKNIRLIINKKNLGYTRSANIGLKSSSAEYKILLNSDTVVDQDWIEKLVAVGESSDSIGIVGPLSNAATYQSIPEIRPTIKKSMNFFSKSNKNTVINILPNGLSIAQINKFVSRYHTKNSIPIVPLLHGFCLCIKASLLDDIGYFDEKNFAKFYGEENDFCMRSTIAGYKLAVATNVFVFHKKSASIAENDRVLHMDKAGKTLRNIYGAESIKIACMQMEKNPILELIRRESKLFFKKFV